MPWYFMHSVTDQISVQNGGFSLAQSSKRFVTHAKVENEKRLFHLDKCIETSLISMALCGDIRGSVLAYPFIWDQD